MLRALVAVLFVLTAASSASGPSSDAFARAAPEAQIRDNLDAPRSPDAPHAKDAPRSPDLRPSATAPAGTLPFFYDLYTFRGDRNRTMVVAAFAVPAGRLEEERRSGQVRYRFDVTLVLADTADRSVIRTDDSVFVGAPRPLDGEHLLFTHIEVQAPPSGSTVQRVIMTDAAVPGIGQLYDSSFRIPDYSGSRLMLSDIALGKPDAEGGWRRGDVTLALLPTSQFPESAFEVYYEIYNLPDGHRYTTEIAVERVDPRTGRILDDDVARLRFSGESSARPDGSLQELRNVEAYLGKGQYQLTVTITDEATGETASRARLFRVRGWGPGATMVAALPRTTRSRDR